MTTNIKRTSFYFTEHERKILEALSLKLNMTKTAVIRRALRLLASEEGKK